MIIIYIIIAIVIWYFIMHYIQKEFFNRQKVLERKIKKTIGADIDFIDTSSYKEYALILLEINGKKWLINYKMDVIYPFELENIFSFWEYFRLDNLNDRKQNNLQLSQYKMCVLITQKTLIKRISELKAKFSEVRNSSLEFYMYSETK